MKTVTWAPEGANAQMLIAGTGATGQDHGGTVGGSAGGSRAGDGAWQRTTPGSATSSGQGTDAGRGHIATGGAATVRGANAGDAQSGLDRSHESLEPGVPTNSDQQRERAGTDGRSGQLDQAGVNGPAPVSNTLPDRRGRETETDKQVSYDARSKSSSVGTLVPINMRDAVQDSLDRLESQVGDLDEYVADRLNIDVPNLYASFSAEQVDALAMSINNAENGDEVHHRRPDRHWQGASRRRNDQVRHQRGLTPIFVTEKPNLYADMLRGIADIGMGEEIGYGTDGLRVLMTNADEKIPYGDDGEFYSQDSRRNPLASFRPLL